jgi:hypothetical protein
VAQQAQLVREGVDLGLAVAQCGLVALKLGGQCADGFGVLLGLVRLVLSLIHQASHQGPHVVL